MDPTDLRREARRRYERGRFLWALSRSVPILAVAPLMLLLSPYRVLAAVSAVCLLTASVALLFEGTAYAAAVLPGLFCGSIPVGFCALASRTNQVCTAQMCSQICMASCVSGGLLAGFLVGRQAARLASGRPAFLISAGLICALFATPVCALAGLSGVLGMLGGVAVGTAPGLLFSAKPA